MRIVIEVDGEKVTAIGPDAAPASTDAAAAMAGDPVPGPASPELLERARKLGALSAGAAQFGRGAALAAPPTVVSEPRAPGRVHRRAAAKSSKTTQGSRRKRARRR